MGKKKFGDKFLGFVRIITFIHSEGFVTRKIEPIEGSPLEEYEKDYEELGVKIPNF